MSRLRLTFGTFCVALCVNALAASSAPLAALAATAPTPAAVIVKTPAAFASAVKSAKAGDTIVLADGEWRDFQMVVEGQGQPDRPITVTGQTPGRVKLTGQSNLRMAGQYLVVSNLVFVDGYSPTGEVVSFRRSRESRAVHSRVTGVVIDGFSKPDRRESDNWVALYGHHNRFDHSTLVGKTNTGTTLVVVRDAQQGLANYHRIDHNYFGPRPSLGSNGGETIRVGTSHDATSDSFTTVEYNWFERCDGEVEIISNKSGANVYRGNVFFESQGALTLRHGDGNLVEDNVFLGNGVPNTGGIRVINRGQIIRNNYMENLTGTGFASALAVMYGVPNSPANRYVQVEDARIENNTLINVASIYLGAGMDAERSAAPVNSVLAKNLIANTNGLDPIRVLGDMSGLALNGNVQSPAGSARPALTIDRRDVALTRNASGLLTPTGVDGVGARRDLRFVRKRDTGASWYPRTAPQAAFGSGQSLQVGPGEDTLSESLAVAGAGDHLTLAPGVYVVNRVLTVSKPVSISGPATGTATIVFNRPTLFDIAPGGSLKINRLSISGEAAPDSAGNAVIRTSAGAANFRLIIEDSRIANLTINRAFDVIAMTKGTTAGQIVLRRVVVEAVSGSVLAAHTETDNLGFYNAEMVEISDSTFTDIAGPAIDLYRGGTDESTFGPRIAVTNSTFTRVGAGLSTPAAIALEGVQVADLKNNRFENGGGVRFLRTVGSPLFRENGTILVNAPATWTNLMREPGAQ